MAVGTNEFEEFDVQFLVCGVTMSGADFAEQIYILKTVENYWNHLYERPLVSNLPPDGDRDRSLTWAAHPVQKVMEVNGEAGVYEFPQFKCWEPNGDDYETLIHEYNIARTQQAIRLRFKDGKERTVYVFGNLPLPSMLVNDVMVEDDIYSEAY